MHTSTHGHGQNLRRSTRTWITLVLALALLGITAISPAIAGETVEDDLESVRATVTAKYNQKISLLGDKMSATENEEKRAAYASGIAELRGLLDTRVATEDSVDELWALKERAYAIYDEAVRSASQAGKTDAELLTAAKKKASNAIESKINLLKARAKECQGTSAEDILSQGVAQLKSLFAAVDSAATPDAAYAVKEQAYGIHKTTIKAAEEAVSKDGCDKVTEEEKAEKELRNARWATLTLIERKSAILLAAANATANSKVSAIFAEAAREVAELEGVARSARTVKALKEVDGDVMRIYHAAKDAVAALRGESDAAEHDKDPARTLEAHLAKIANYADRLTAIASGTETESPETFEAVVQANKRLQTAITSALEVTESGKNLDDRWTDLSLALKEFKQAFVAHYIALAKGPFTFGGLHIPG